MATQYDPILKDSTGQAIVTKLEGIKNAINPTAENIPITTIEGMEAENVQSGLEELKGTLTDLIKISTCTVMGNGTKYANNDVTAITGYTAIGIVGYDPSGSFVAGYELAGLSVNISTQKVYATWGVDLGSNAGITAKVLYVRNGSAS